MLNRFVNEQIVAFEIPNPELIIEKSHYFVCIFIIKGSSRKLFMFTIGR